MREDDAGVGCEMDNPEYRREARWFFNTGHQGIRVYPGYRGNKNQSWTRKVITVFSVQMVEDEGEPFLRQTHLLDLSESAYRADPAKAHARVIERLNHALWIQRYHQSLVEAGEILDRFLRVEDVPDAFKTEEGDWGHLDLDSLFRAIPDKPSSFTPATTGGCARSLAIKLQNADLSKPQGRLALNGHHMNFRETSVEGHTFFLPTGICRVRGGWKLFLRCRDGIWQDRLYDEGLTLKESLREAWIYLVSEMRQRPVMDKRLEPVAAPLWFTGVIGGSFLTHFRNGDWKVQLSYRHKDALGKEIRRTVAYWSVYKVTDRGLRTALRRLAGLDRYVQTEGPEIAFSAWDAGHDVPLRYWPTEPVVPVLADDLRYGIEQKPDKPSKRACHRGYKVKRKGG